MTPQELIDAGRQIQRRWPDALIYPNIAGRNPGVPDNVCALAVDVDRVWPHDCDGDPDCNECMGSYRLVAWVDIVGAVHALTPNWPC